MDALTQRETITVGIGIRRELTDERLPTPAEMRALADQVQVAIAIETASACDLMETASQFEGDPMAAILRDLARRHRVHTITLKARLAGLVAAIRMTRGQ